jgi:hypothetical protein
VLRSRQLQWSPDYAELLPQRREIALFHYTIEGLVFDRLTSPLDPATGTDEIVDALVAGLIDGTRVTGSRRTPSR